MHYRAETPRLLRPPDRLRQKNTEKALDAPLALAQAAATIAVGDTEKVRCSLAFRVVECDVASFSFIRCSNHKIKLLVAGWRRQKNLLGIARGMGGYTALLFSGGSCGRHQQRPHTIWPGHLLRAVGIAQNVTDSATS